MNSSIVDLSQKEGPVVLSDFCILFHLRIGSHLISAKCRAI